MPKPSQIIKDARELLSDETKWTLDALARNSAGWSVEPDDPTACQWCSAGALLHSCGGNSEAMTTDYLAAYGYVEQVVGMPVAVFNDDDDTTHQDVLTALDAAYALAAKTEAGEA